MPMMTVPVAIKNYSTVHSKLLMPMMTVQKVKQIAPKNLKVSCWKLSLKN